MDKKDESFDIDWKMEGFWEAAGEIPYTATNDFMFHMLMQKNMDSYCSLGICIYCICPAKTVNLAMERAILHAKHRPFRYWSDNV